MASGKTIGFNGSFYTTQNISATTNYSISNQPIIVSNIGPPVRASLINILDITSSAYYGDQQDQKIDTTIYNISCDTQYTYTLYIDCLSPDLYAVYIIHPRTLSKTLLSSTPGFESNIIVNVTSTFINISAASGSYNISYNLVINNKQPTL